MNSIFWMIGYRYHCPNCKNPKSQKKTVTFRSWDSRILSALPRALQLEFPAILTRRSALSKSAFTMMRSCIQNGMGTKQFSTSLRMHHLERYDELHLQYLHTVAQRRLANWCGVTAVVFPEFFDKSEGGFHGFIPSSSWLRNMYDNFIKEHQQDINQHISLLSADVCAIDHSHKITKHIARINGVQVFTGLLTLTNDFGEIRVCTLVATKSHEQFRAALENMKTSLVTYGHKPPSLFYTDNMADKQFLEEVFPSLREDVTPVEKHAHLPIFTIPESPEVLIHVKQATAAIDQAARTILDTIPIVDGGLSGQIVVGLDIEWNAEVQPYGGVVRERTAAVVQIACGNVIYILQVGDLLAAQQLPYQLRLLLANPSVIKVGCGVIADLHSLEVASGSKTPFVDEILSNDQINYAARDAYASLAIYNVLITIPTPHPLSDILTPQTPVFLYHRDNTRIIAHGKLSTRLGQTTYDGIKITSKRTIVTITKILIPGAIVNFYKKSLQEFGQPNFDLVVLRSHLRIAPLLQEFPVLPPAPPAPVLPAILPPALSATVEVEKADENGVASIQPSSIPDEELDQYISDPVSAAQGQHILKPVPANWPDFLRSRVLKDPFHVFNMFYISRTHGLRATFARALRDAIFIPNKEDIMRIDQWGMMQDPPVSYEKLKVTSPKFIHRHCRRIIPPPEILYPLVHSVFQTFGHLQDAKTRQPLFNENSWKVANNILSLLQNGYVSDPPGIPLYSQIGIDCKAGNLPVYRCFRGTNFTEGGVHTQLRPRLPTSGASVRHVYSCLLDFILRHNLLVGTHNRTGQVYKGHTSIWLTNEIQECLISLHDTVQEVPQLVGWINGNFYESTSEVAGILPIPMGVQESCGIATYLPTHDAKQPNAFLASMQQTRKPVVPIHSPVERDLFRKLLREDPTFNNSRTGPQWKQAIKVWNRKAEEQSDITYKLIEHLTSYFTEWNTSLNVKESLTMSTTERKTLRDYIRGHQLDQRAPTVPPTTLAPPLRAPANNSTTSEATPGTLNSKSAHCDPRPGSSIHEVMVQLSRKRVADSLENNKPVKKARIRHCAKCGRRECRGNQRAHWCSNACQDCGKSSCRGRNSKKPQMRCDQGWD
ncbi:hypothetical protein AGABI2DRAFT_215844 [Agaricus bisporus var. bisporus H97]|uniref:hypothetical protein n=1 Tax=Agaricus bisporus var. bisporus (strain H97 / ATCC MYA-4626 / FGSC 10389) TaxID=936046 RepID=UPI00029F7989|nr:hypothetical protein AGABI2DRAFT_215844 [Agaricus bisporus var. bisporus H97]EKV49824.1 hypothetical protein AGABI2DRAFT_215844 [Agaricus bisporus var. bisporus H97]